MGKLPHETMGWDAIYDGSWKNSPSYKEPWHISRRLKAFLGLNLPMRHRFDIRELFIREEDFDNKYISQGFNFPNYKQCWRRLCGKQ